jgi:DNA repair protein RadA/Sms
MSKTRSTYACSECKATFAKWLGKCTQCQAWGTVEEVAPAASASVGLKSTMTSARPTRSAQRVGDIKTDRHKHRTTGVSELDRVLGGGLVRGGVVLLAGEPGVGKSTITLGLADKMSKSGWSVLIASGEESAEQIKMRADRIGADATDLYIASETDVSVVLGQIEEVQPDLLIVDSLQTIASPDVDGRTGGVAQVTEVATILARTAKARGMALIIIGQVTKDGNIAGPRVVEHLVDVVIHAEGDKHSPLRFLRGVKNRFGAADEVGCFVMTASGMEEVADPSGLFLGNREEPVPGTCVTVIVEGKRPLLAEVQALVAPTQIPVPRRGSSGLDSARLAMTQAVTERHGKVRLYDKDVYCATVGGVKIVEPSADLALALAMASAANDTPLRGDVLALGEVALSGDVRPVPDIERRLAEAARMGFRTALVPSGTKDRLDRTSKIILVEVDNIGRAMAALTSMGAARRMGEAS